MRIASSICFEALFPGFNRKELLQGADLLVNLSNDGWFGHSNVPYMHLQAARWRALEARRWLVRASDSGISAIISPLGEVVTSIPYGEAGVRRAPVFAQRLLTPFIRWGNWFLWVELLLFLLGAALHRSIDPDTAVRA
jgi:apolipoprotein N-acyltransferase